MSRRKITILGLTMKRASCGKYSLTLLSCSRNISNRRLVLMRADNALNAGKVSMCKQMDAAR